MDLGGGAPGGGTVELNVRATGLEPGAAGLRVAAVTTDDGRRLERARSSWRPGPRRRRTCWRRSTRRPPPACPGRRLVGDGGVRPAHAALPWPAILLNADRDGGWQVDLICQTTNVTRRARRRAHILLATR